jgi:hypothetical protein
VGVLMTEIKSNVATVLMRASVLAETALGRESIPIGY